MVLPETSGVTQQGQRGRPEGCQRADQPVIDTTDERDGAARNTGHQLGHSHEQAANKHTES